MLLQLDAPGRAVNVIDFGNAFFQGEERQARIAPVFVSFAKCRHVLVACFANLIACGVVQIGYARNDDPAAAGLPCGKLEFGV